MKYLFKTILTVFAGFFAVGVILVMAAYVYVAPELPSVSTLKDIRLQTPLRVYTREKRLIAEFGEKRRIPVEFSEIPKPMVDAFLAIEDARFFEHPGIDYRGLLRAAAVLLQTGEKKQGGSTITMQLARNYFLSSERTYIRKIKEIFLALLIEREFDKREILNLYLNKIFLGHRAYGVGAAAEVYYGKSSDQLDLAQIAMIAGLPKAPSHYNPLSYPEVAVKRRNLVLQRMLELDMISRDEYEKGAASPITASRRRVSIETAAPYVAEMVRAEMVDRYGSSAYTGGYEVITTVKGKYQEYADDSLKKSLIAYDLRHGWRDVDQSFNLKVNDPVTILADYSPLGNLQPAVITRLSGVTAAAVLKDGSEAILDEAAYVWGRKYRTENHRGLPPNRADELVSVGDLVWLEQRDDSWLLRQLPAVQGAIVALAADTGAVLALSGGFDFSLSKFNRVLQARRQPGSSFKPFVYSAALTRGYTPASVVVDAPVVFSESGTSQDWRPSNYSRKFSGPIRLRQALKDSRNLVSVRLVDSLGIRETIQHVLRFGFDRTGLPHNLTFALGSGAISPLELAAGYAAFANGGFKIEPYFISEVYSDGRLEFRAEPPIVCPSCSSDTLVEDGGEAVPGNTFAERIISPGVAYQLTSMMQDVVRSGTGRRARVLERKDIAGKTGTTNEQVDAWFSGFNRHVVATTWVGFDEQKPLGRYETGSRAALPMWIDFMRRALGDAPESVFYKPDNIVSARIDTVTGLLAHPASTDNVLETFRAEYLPKEIANMPDDGDSPDSGTEDTLF